MKKWMMKHWILTGLLIMIILGGVMSGFDDAQNESLESTIPNHNVIGQFDLINGNNLLEVNMPSLNNETSKNELEVIARDLGEKYNATQIQIYCSLEAQKANNSSSYNEENPNALEECFLGEFQL